MPPGGSVADIGVKPCNYRVGDTHLRGHLIARFAFMEKVSLFHCVSLGTLTVGIHTDTVNRWLAGQRIGGDLFPDRWWWPGNR